MTAAIDIVVRSYYRDRHWLTLALRSIAMFASGYRQVVVVVPQASVSRMNLTVSEVDMRLLVCRDYDDDYLGQQITKLHADLCTDADAILHLDSDQVFVAPCDLQARLFDQGRPRMVFDSSSRRQAIDGWRHCPSGFFGEPVPLDLTAPPPLVVPSHVHAELRALCCDLHGRSITEYALAAGADRFCEFALLRGYALTREPEEYAWIDAVHHRLLPECQSFWSRAETPASVADRLPAALASEL